MVTTGYTDTFARTVSGGLGTATSGQTYTLIGTASQYNVSAGTASILPTAAITLAGYLDLQTQDLDITGQVSLSAIPATNLDTVGFISKLSSTSNYFSGTMMVATGGAISLRFSKVVAGGLITISTTPTGLTYVANAVYNLRYQIYWSPALQTNVMSLKLWAVGAAQPGGWMATANDASFTQYTSGTQVGIMTRDESSTPGTITAKIQNVATTSYNLPMPATTDPMCMDPAVVFPTRTAIQSLAAAADAVVATIDPFMSIVAAFPRVRISRSNFAFSTAPIFVSMQFDTVEFNIGTLTNIGYNANALLLPVGIWLVTFEVRLTNAGFNYLTVIPSTSNASASVETNMRSNASQSNDSGVGGTAHMSALLYSTDPATPAFFGVTLQANNTATTYTVAYMALSAIKISDYFA